MPTKKQQIIIKAADVLAGEYTVGSSTLALPIPPEGANQLESLQPGSFVVGGCGRLLAVEAFDDLEDFEITETNETENAEVVPIVSTTYSFATIGQILTAEENELPPLFEPPLLEQEPELNLDIPLILEFNRKENDLVLNLPDPPRLIVDAVNDNLTLDYFDTFNEENDGEAFIDILFNDSFTGPVSIKIITDDVKEVVISTVEPGAPGESDRLKLTEFFAGQPGFQSVITYEISDGFTSDQAILTINWTLSGISP